MRRLPLTYALLLLAFCATAQLARFKFFTTAEGLVNNNVGSIAQNDQGFIWLLNGTKLLRFDGRKFQEFSMPAGSLNPSEQITSVSCYQDSLLFILTRKRVLLLNPRNGRAEAFTLPEWNGKRYSPNRYVTVGPGNILLHAFQDEDPNEKAFWYFRNKKFEQAPISWDKTWENYPFIATSSPDGETCLLTPDGCFFSGKSGKRTLKFPFHSKASPIPWSAAFEADGSLLAIIDSYFFKVEKSGNTLLPHRINRLLGNTRRQYRDFNTENDGSIWACGGDKTLIYYDARLDTLFDFRRELETLIPYSCDFHALLQDESGVIWVATQMGLLKVVPQPKSFDTYFAGLGDNKTYFSFRGMVEDDAGMVYGSYYTGGAKIDPENKREYSDAFPLAYLPFGLHIAGDQLWLNTGPVWNTSSKTLTMVPGSLRGEDGGVFAKDKQGVLWRAYHYSLYQLAHGPGGMRWEEMQRLPGNGLWSPDVMHTGQHSGLIWIGLGEQLLAWSPQLKKLTRYGPEDLGQSLIRIMSVFENVQGAVWLGTDNGLIFFNPASGKTRRYSTKDGLPNNFVCGMLPEGDSCLWLSTNHGLSRFAIQAGTFLNFFKEDGLTDNEFNRASYLKARNGRMFFGGVKGVNAFFPQELMHAYRRRNEAAHLQLTLFECTDERRDTLVREINFTKHPEIHIYHWERSFSFEYALTDYINPEEIQYSYLMEGYEEIWSAPSKFNFTRFSSLPSGEYIFRVKARDSRGMWHPKQLAVRVVVHPPWWATWWAYILYGALVIAIAYFLLRYELNRQQLRHSLDLEKLEATRLKELDSFKTRLYTNLTHEFRTPLTVILGMAEQIKDNTAARLIESNGKNLLRLINQLLDLSRLENKSFKLQLQQGDIVPYLRYVTESFQTYANSNNLSLRFFTTIDALEMDYDPEQIKQVLTNLISNAVKFTPSGGEVAVRLSEQDGALNLEVKDTGIGISAENMQHIFDRFYQVDTKEGAGSGIGLAHTQELVKLMGGHISATSMPGKGSSFLVRLPIRNVAEQAQEFRVQEQPQTSMPKSSPAPVSNDSGLPQLLVIEDNPDVVVYLKTCLESRYQVDVAYNGRIGIEKAIKHIPDLIISDVMMPEKDGYQVCDTLKNDERTSHIPIILLTAKADTDSKLTGLRRGADAYLTKPFDKEELLVRLEQLVERQNRMMAHFSKRLLSEASAVSSRAEPEEAIQVEDAFIQKLRKIVAENFADEDFALPQLCKEVGMSRSQLFRKMQAVSNTPPSDFIRIYRLQRAKELLETGHYNISEVAWEVGFKTLPHFSKKFHDYYGYPPSKTHK